MQAIPVYRRLRAKRWNYEDSQRGKRRGRVPTTVPHQAFLPWSSYGAVDGKNERAVHARPPASAQ
jgi:hypothetical protein